MCCPDMDQIFLVTGSVWFGWMTYNYGHLAFCEILRKLKRPVSDTCWKRTGQQKHKNMSFQKILSDFCCKMHQRSLVRIGCANTEMLHTGATDERGVL